MRRRRRRKVKRSGSQNTWSCSTGLQTNRWRWLTDKSHVTALHYLTWNDTIFHNWWTYVLTPVHSFVWLRNNLQTIWTLSMWQLKVPSLNSTFSFLFTYTLKKSAFILMEQAQFISYTFLWWRAESKYLQSDYYHYHFMTPFTTRRLCSHKFNISIVDTFTHASWKPPTLSQHGVCGVQKNSLKRAGEKAVFPGQRSSRHLRLIFLRRRRLRLAPQSPSAVWLQGEAAAAHNASEQQESHNQSGAAASDALVTSQECRLAIGWPSTGRERDRGREGWVGPFKCFNSWAPPTGLEGASGRVQVEWALSLIFQWKTWNFCTFTSSCLSPQGFYSSSSSEAPCLS